MRNGSLSLDAFLARRAGDRRLARLTHDLPLPEAAGLEFGPGNNPVPLPDGVRIVYVDHAADAPGDWPDAVAIDRVWTGEGTLSGALNGAGRPNGFDFALAAQVAQYVPNLLGWFQEIHSVLKPGGVVNLSLPDRRFMFDAARTDSTLAELVEAHLLRATRPSLRQIFSHTAEVRNISPERIWAGDDPRAAPRMAGDDALVRAFAAAGDALTNGIDPACHCWVFTPLTFLDLVEGASHLGLFPLVLNRIAPTEPGSFEFFVSMRRDGEEDAAALRTMQRNAVAFLRGGLERQSRAAGLIARP